MTPVILTKVFNEKLYVKFEPIICPSDQFNGRISGPIFDTVKSSVSGLGSMLVTVDGYSYDYLDDNSVVSVSVGTPGVSDDAAIVISPDFVNVYALFSASQVGSDIFTSAMEMRFYDNGAYTDLGGGVYTPYSGSAEIGGGLSYYDNLGTLIVRRIFGISGGTDRYIAINGAGSDPMIFQINDESDVFSIADFNETFANPYFANGEDIVFCLGTGNLPTYITDLNSGTAFFEIQFDDANLQGGTFNGYVGSSKTGMFGPCVYFYIVGADSLNYILEIAENNYNAFEIDGPVPTAFCRVGGFGGTFYMVGDDGGTPTLLLEYTPAPPVPSPGTGLRQYSIGAGPAVPIQSLGCANYCQPLFNS